MMQDARSILLQLDNPCVENHINRHLLSLQLAFPFIFSLDCIYNGGAIVWCNGKRLGFASAIVQVRVRSNVMLDLS